MLALLAREGDLRAYVGCSHGLAFLELTDPVTPVRAYRLAGIPTQPPGGSPDVTAGGSKGARPLGRGPGAAPPV
ncbi:hypothetical protein GCM10009634_24390 [Saccharothrix xinjiangensis]